MPKRTKRENAEIVEIYYGIDSATHEVVSVSRTRGGMLSRIGKFGSVNHPIHPSNRNDPRTEVIVVWHLTDVISFPPFMRDSESTKADIARLIHPK